jgi:hypothetical protein
MHITGGTITVGSNFSVANDGSVTASSMTITGGSIKIGSNFSVDSSGNLKATNADLSGKITATSGSIGGISIGSGISGSGWSITSSGGLSCSSITLDGTVMRKKWIEFPALVTSISYTGPKFNASTKVIKDGDGDSVIVCTGGDITFDLDYNKTVPLGFSCLGA